MSLTVRQILQGKTRALLTVVPSYSIIDALRIMATHEVGSVLVTEAEKLLGIFTERDYARKVALKGRNSRETTVADLMTTKVLTVSPTQSLEECMAIMTNERIRHLPVVENGALIGIVTIGDVIKAIIADQQNTISHLHQYISGELIGKPSSLPSS